MIKESWGYSFAILTEHLDGKWYAYTPGVGGVYEQGDSKDEAIKNAYKSACSILDARTVNGDLLTEDNEYLKVLDSPPIFDTIKTGHQTVTRYIATPSCGQEPVYA